MIAFTKFANAPPLLPFCILLIIILKHMWRKALSKPPTRTSLFQRRCEVAHFGSQTHYIPSSEPPMNSDVLADAQVNCLMLHPVTWPNHGPNIELYLAEEAIGLVRSLDWEVARGPLWKSEEERDSESHAHLYFENAEGEGSDPNITDNQTERLTTSEAEGTSQTEISISQRQTFQQRRSSFRISHAKNARMFKEERIKDGDYVYGPEIQGVYYKKGGIIMEMDNDDLDNKEADMYDEWKNILIRESMAKSSLIRVRKIHSSTFFTKGKLNELGYFVKDNKDINVIFVNATLTSLQQKKLEKRFNDIILSREDRLRKYYLKSAQKEKFNPTDVESESSQMSELEVQPTQSNGQPGRKIRVIDRFGIILQIFASRAKTRAAQLQLELAWLKYARTMLVRGGAPTFGQLGSIFQGNMMRLDVQEVGIKSARGRKSGGSGSGGQIGGEGETQLEIERRKLTDRETKISKELESIKVRSEHEKAKREASHQTLPLIGLIGYTNAGKTALMNLCTGSHLESKDLLFQTLNTTHKRFRMPNGQLGLMLDTVGFITNLPHGLVESFKTTLEEIHSAEVLVHVRDISNPHTNYQRDTVIKVLKDIGVPDEVFQTRYLEVWNKIDLLENQEEFLEQLKQDMLETTPNYPVVMMSCQDGTNKDLFMSEIQNLTAQVMGKRFFTLRYRYHMHDRVTKWLVEHASLSSGTVEGSMEYDDQGFITVQAPIDEVVYQQYLKQFEPEKFEDERVNQRRSGRMAPPPGWNEK